MFDPIWKLLLGLLTGLIFGILLQKGRVAKYEVILGQFLGKDFTVVKIMGTAVVVGSIGVYAFLPTGLYALSIKPLLWSGLLIGGGLFGIGMSTLGYCPGTGVAACGEGRKDAYAGLLGMFCGALLYVFYYPSFSWLAKCLGDAGKITAPQWTNTSPWIWIIPMAVLGILMMLLSLRRTSAAPK
jgi:uncharacterized protein